MEKCFRQVVDTKNVPDSIVSLLLSILSVYKDTNTASPYLDDFTVLGDDGENPPGRQALPDHVYMDCMGFGMGCSCLQMTFQACSIDEARYLYDQLTPLCPIIVSILEFLCHQPFSMNLRNVD